MTKFRDFGEMSEQIQESEKKQIKMNIQPTSYLCVENLRFRRGCSYIFFKEYCNNMGVPLCKCLISKGFLSSPC